MSDQDLPADAAVETEVADPMDDLPPFPEEEQETPDEEQTEEADADAEEQVDEETEGSEEAPAEDAGEADAAPDLSSIPEEYRETAQAVAARQVADLQRSYEQKLQEAAEHRKSHETVEAFEQRLQDDPKGLIADLQGIIAEEQPADTDPEPEKPGDLPNEYATAEETAKWILKDRQHAEWRTRQLLKQQEEKIMSTVAPALETTQRLQAQAQAASLKQQLKVEDDEFDEIMAEAQKTRGNPEQSWASMKELVRLRKENAALKSGKVEKTREQIRGSEEKSGLPSTGQRKAPPRQTGDIKKDVDASLKHDGVEFPKGH